MKNIIWYIFVTVLVIIAIIGDIRMVDGHDMMIKPLKKSEFKMQKENISEHKTSCPLIHAKSLRQPAYYT